jgi:hypothetical protein
MPFPKKFNVQQITANDSIHNEVNNDRSEAGEGGFASPSKKEKFVQQPVLILGASRTPSSCLRPRRVVFACAAHERNCHGREESRYSWGEILRISDIRTERQMNPTGSTHFHLYRFTKPAPLPELFVDASKANRINCRREQLTSAPGATSRPVAFENRFVGGLSSMKVSRRNVQAASVA